MKKKLYVQPDVRVVALRVTNRLLEGSQTFTLGTENRGYESAGEELNWGED
jgi:hypothetical protein